jgi:HEAT repeat protein
MRSAIRVMEVALVVWVTTIFSLAQTPQENAWSTLNSGLENKSWEKRAKAVAVLGELTEDKKAEEAAIAALQDQREEVRGAACQALGEMGTKSAIPLLIGMKDDKEPAVILAASRALITLGDHRGYNAFYAVLTGETKTGTSLTDQQKKVLKDPKKLAGMGLEVGVGFIPFGGLAMGGYKTLTKDDTSPVLAAAALVLAKDPDPKSGKALVDAAANQKKWLVRAAAYDAIAKRGDPSLLSTAIDGLQDPQDEVQYSAAGAVLRLSDIEAERRHRKPAAKPKTEPRKTH